MMPRVIVRPAADQDLDEQFDYLAESSLAAAYRLLDAARDTFAELARMPGMGKRKRLPSRRLVGLRQWPVHGFPNHLIFYREISTGIEVLRVLHGARDIDRLLLEQL